MRDPSAIREEFATQNNTRPRESFTVGAGSIQKVQPWKTIIKDSRFLKPSEFVTRTHCDGSKGIRLLQELDSKSR
jgi:hypothetical protein